MTVKHGQRHARGENLEAIRPCIKVSVRYDYKVIFLEMARGKRKRLQHRFHSLVRGCEAMYWERLHTAQEHKAGK
ncbi:MAG TPA: hypothetical protein VGL94_18720 [Ktedonobacteraceae bacterium]|jgi:hypothetical protein